MGEGTSWLLRADWGLGQEWLGPDTFVPSCPAGLGSFTRTPGQQDGSVLESEESINPVFFFFLPVFGLGKFPNFPEHLIFLSEKKNGNDETYFLGYRKD